MYHVIIQKILQNVIRFCYYFNMKYEKIIKAKFLERPNRFVAIADVQGKPEKVHVKNTGRCRELLIPGATVYLEDFGERMGSRKMRYSLIAVEKAVADGYLLINMDSQAPNKVVKEALMDGRLLLPEMGKITYVKPEAKYGDSRLDFFLRDEEGNEAYAEVKGVTLEEDGIAAFPDAPTERGIKHLLELKNAIKEGKKAYAIFVIQMKGVEKFKPNDRTHKAFGDALRMVVSEGVIPVAIDCIVTEDSLVTDKDVEIVL